MIIPPLAIAGQPEPQEARPAVARHVPGDHAALHGAARRRDRDRRRADVLPGAQPRPDRRALPDERAGRCSDGDHAASRVDLGSRSIVRRAVVDAVRKLAPAHDGAQPGDVRRRGRQRADHAASRPATSPTGGRRSRLRAADHVLAVAHRALRQLRRGDGRGARQGAGRHAAQGQDRDHRARASARTARSRPCPPPRLRKGDVVLVDGRRGHPGRRRDHRRRRVGGRVGHHRRVGAGHPRVGRRSLGGDRRHARCCRTGSTSG